MDFESNVFEDVLKKPEESTVEETPVLQTKPDDKPLLINSPPEQTERVSLRVNGFEMDIGSAYTTAQELAGVIYAYYLQYRKDINGTKRDPSGVN